MINQNAIRWVKANTTPPGNTITTLQFQQSPTGVIYILTIQENNSPSVQISSSVDTFAKTILAQLYAAGRAEATRTEMEKRAEVLKKLLE